MKLWIIHSLNMHDSGMVPLNADLEPVWDASESIAFYSSHAQARAIIAREVAKAKRQHKTRPDLDVWVGNVYL